MIAATVSPAARHAAELLTGAATVAGARADFMPFGAARTAMSAGASRGHSLAQAIERGVEITPERFAQAVREIDADYADGGKSALPAQADKLIAAYAA
jgi:hypothetical protein